MAHGTREKLERLVRQFRLFPNLETIGSYEHLSQVIRLHKAGATELATALQGKDPATALEILPTLEHEATHWRDHIATLWGQDSILLGMNALSARAGNDPKDFWRIITYFNHMRRNYASEYYHTVLSDEPWDGKPWRWDLSTGVRFNLEGRMNDSDPILFVRFHSAAGEQMCRVPVSVAALLEVRAVYAEITCEQSL